VLGVKNMVEIYERLTSIFHDVFDDEDIVLTADLTADEVAEWDSLRHIQLILAVQKSFKIRFSAADILSLNNVGDLATLIKAKLK
jgi:acyl carrier protein